MMTDISAVLEIFWTEEELGDSGWSKGDSTMLILKIYIAPSY